eukprot:443508_1
MSSSSTKPSLCIKRYIPKPSYDPTNKNCIIITANYKEEQTTSGICKYNIVTNEWHTIYKYNENDNTFKPHYHGQFIDKSNNTLILYGGGYDTFKVFDLNNNQMKQINDTNIICKCDYEP